MDENAAQYDPEVLKDNCNWEDQANTLLEKHWVDRMEKNNSKHKMWVTVSKGRELEQEIESCESLNLDIEFTEEMVFSKIAYD